MPTTPAHAMNGIATGTIIKTGVAEKDPGEGWRVRMGETFFGFVSLLNWLDKGFGRHIDIFDQLFNKQT